MTTFSSPLPTPFTSPPIPPSIGDLLYLAAYVFEVKVTAIATMPDTPDQYSAQIKILNDAGDMDLSALVGNTGIAGVGSFVLRDQTDEVIVNNVFELPRLDDTFNDVGKYWRLDTLDAHGHVIMVTAYVWFGNGWRAFMMGSFGPPGPIPSVHPSCRTIPPGEKSYVLTSGPTFQPSWIFELAVPQGAVGPPGPLAFFPDIEEGGVDNLDVLVATGYLESGELLWQPLRIEGGVMGPYSMAENLFNSYSGQSQQAAIGQFVLPPQPFPWTPVVWGHIGSIGGQGGSGGLGGDILGSIFEIINDVISTIFGFLFGGLSAAPLNIGCEVLLGDQKTGTMVARGFGNQTGLVNIMPHYSTSANKKASITPTNNYAVVGAHHTDPKEGTLYINLWNDGNAQTYNFHPVDAQLFIAVVAIQPPFTTITGTLRTFALHGTSTLKAKVQVLSGTVLEAGQLGGHGGLSVQVG